MTTINTSQTINPLKPEVKAWVAVGPGGDLAVLYPLYKRNTVTLDMGITMDFEGEEPVAVAIDAGDGHMPLLSWAAWHED